MNISYLPVIPSPNSIPPAFEQLGHEITKATSFLLIPAELLYFSVYFHRKGFNRLYKICTFLSLATLWLAPFASPVSCGPARCLQNFAIAVGTMKLLDMWARRNSLPTYTAGKTPPDWLYTLIILAELRYESFTPNHIRVPKSRENFSEPLQLGIHVAAFVFLQSLPQSIPTVVAFEVMLAIYIIWTSMHLLLRYKSSPALFGPLYLIDSLSGFWSETWHNVFSSPCTALAYSPLRYGLPKYGVPIAIARSCGVLGAFGLMALFHMFALRPILTNDALVRVGVFFALNGVATVAEAAVWGHRKHVVKTLLAWVFETCLATWTASGMKLPNGLSKIPWESICDA